MHFTSFTPFGHKRYRNTARIFECLLACNYVQRKLPNFERPFHIRMHKQIPNKQTFYQYSPT